MTPRKIAPELLGFDFDGVVADTAETFIRLACEEYGYCSFTIEDITDFDVERCLDMEPDKIRAIFSRILVDSVETGLKPMAGAVEVIGELTEHAPVTIVTARPYPEPVLAWLRTVFPTSTRQHIRTVAMGEHDGKPYFVRREGLRYFIDDRPETCLQLAEAGIMPLVFSQPWNRNRHNLQTVSCWQEIKNLCL